MPQVLGTNKKVTKPFLFEYTKRRVYIMVGVMSFYTANAELLFFILVYLILFYDSSVLLILRGINPKEFGYKKDYNALFFILVFMLLFIRPYSRVHLLNDTRRTYC
jgi:hypothetical protein